MEGEKWVSISVLILIVIIIVAGIVIELVKRFMDV